MVTIAHTMGGGASAASGHHPLDRLVSRWRFIACVQVLDLLLFFAIGFEWSQILVHDSVDHRWILATALSLLIAASGHCAFQYSGLYDFDVLARARDAYFRALIAGSITLGPLVISLLIQQSIARGEAATDAALLGLAIAGIAALRVPVASLASALRHSGVACRRIFIISDAAESGASLSNILQRSADNRVLGVWDLSAQEGPLDTAMQGALDYLRLNAVDVIILKMPLAQADRLLQAAQVLRTLPRTVLLAPTLYFEGDAALGFNAGWGDRLDETGNTILVKLSDRPLAGWSWVAKDIQDRIIALLLLIVVAPVMLAIAVGIRISDPGPIFFRQKRFGYGGDTFNIFKFRTMRVATRTAPENGLRLTTRDDPRVFPFGRFLRKTSLDELPQLFNVILGDMWIVGPRPHSPLATAGGQIYIKAVQGYAARYRIKPGITGWAQVCGWRGPTETLEQLSNRVQHDLYYIENWSPFFDTRILFKTLFLAFGHENAF